MCDCNRLTVTQAQQLSIVKAVLHFDKHYSKSVLVKLHGGCQASFQIFETALLRNCSNSSSSPSSPTGPSRHAKTLLGFASFFGKLHKAQAFLLSAEVEHQARSFGRAIAFAELAKKLFQERTSIGGLGLPPLPGSCERVAPMLMTKRAALDQLHTAWSKENDSIYFDSIPDEASVASIALPQAFIMKPHAFDSEKDSQALSSLDEAQGGPSAQRPLSPCPLLEGCALSLDVLDHHHDEATERIQVIDEHSDDEGEADSASETEVYLERIERRSNAPPVTVDLAELQLQPQAQAQAQTQAQALQPTRQSLINALSDAILSTHPPSAEELSHATAASPSPPTRRQSERAPSVNAAQIAEISAKANSRRKKSEGFEYKAESLERFKAITGQQPSSLQPLPELSRAPTIVSAEVFVSGEDEQHMRAQLVQGKAIFRLAKDTRVHSGVALIADCVLLVLLLTIVMCADCVIVAQGDDVPRGRRAALRAQEAAALLDAEEDQLEHDHGHPARAGRGAVLGQID